MLTSDSYILQEVKLEQFEIVRTHLSTYIQPQSYRSASVSILEDLSLLRSQLRSRHPEAMRHLLHYCQGNALTLDQALQTAYCELHLSLISLRS